MKRMIVIFTVLLFQVSSMAQESKKWMSHELDSKRAMWVWSPTRNKLWDGEKKGKRWRSNYKNCNDLLLDFCQNKSIRVLYLSVSSWQWGKSFTGARTIRHRGTLATKSSGGDQVPPFQSSTLSKTRGAPCGVTAPKAVTCASTRNAAAALKALW